MKNSDSKDPDPDMPDEVDFTGGVRGRYADRFSGGRNIVVLEPDVAARFPDSPSVNRALRALVQMIDEVPVRNSKGRAKTKTTT